MIQVIYSARPPSPDEIWEELLYWRQRIHGRFACGHDREAHLLLRQELAPRMHQWSQRCGLERALQLIHLRNLVRGLGNATRTSAEVPPRPAPGTRRPSASRDRIPFDDIPAIIDALEAEERRPAPHALAS